MRHAALAFAALLAAGPAAAQVSATGPDGSRAVVGTGGATAVSGAARPSSCASGHLAVSGSGHSLRPDGVCRSVEVGGSRNTVRVRVAPGAAITVSGTRNTVLWTLADPGGAAPSVSVSGTESQARRE